jgi:hypothetical protein
MPLQGQENANQHGHGHDGRNLLEKRHNIDIEKSLIHSMSICRRSQAVSGYQSNQVTEACTGNILRNFGGRFRVSNEGYDFCSLQFLTLLYVGPCQPMIEYTGLEKSL